MSEVVASGGFLDGIFGSSRGCGNKNNIGSIIIIIVVLCLLFGNNRRCDCDCDRGCGC